MPAVTGAAEEDRRPRRVSAVPVRIGIAEQAAQQHLVRAGTDAGHHVGRLERGLLDFGEVVLRIAVQRQAAELDRRIVAVRPDLGQVEGIEAVVRRVLERHDLHLHRPARRIAPRDRVEQVAHVVVGILGGHRLRFGVGEVGDALVGLEVILHPELLARGVDPHERVAGVAVHIAPATRHAAVAHPERDLVRGTRARGSRSPTACCGLARW